MCVCELAKQQDRGDSVTLFVIINNCNVFNTGARLLAVGSEDCSIVLVSVGFNDGTFP